MMSLKDIPSFCITKYENGQMVRDGFARVEQLLEMVFDVPAIDGHRQISLDRRMGGGRLGCYYSHLMILLMLEAYGQEHAIIFEDDVVLHATEIPDPPQDWDMIYLGVNHVEPPIDINEHYVKVTRGYTTHGYIIRRKFYPIAINSFIVNRRPADVNYSFLHRDYKCYALKNQIATQDNSKSLIL